MMEYNMFCQNRKINIFIDSGILDGYLIEGNEHIIKDMTFDKNNYS